MTQEELNSKSYSNIYKGIVVQNDDPMQSGRVKVFVPDIHFSLIGLSKEQTNQSMMFGSFGKNVNQQSTKGRIDLTDHIEELKSKLPWALVIQPIVGETGFAKFNSSSKNSTVSDSNDPASTDLGTATTQKEGPQAIYKGDKNVWGDPAYSGGERVDGNPGSYNFEKPYNLPKGNFAIPSVNTQVWVQFIDGNVFSPVVIGAAATAAEWQAHAKPSSYPSTSENTADTSSRDENGGADKDIYRNSTIQNSTAYTTITDNSQGKTSRSEIHVSGTSKTIDSEGNESKYKTGDMRSTVLGSNYDDYRQSRNKHVKGNETAIIKGNSRVVIGSNNVEAAKQQKKLLGNIHQYKSLFETKRTDAEGVFTSPLQSKEPILEECPACTKDGGRSEESLNVDVTKHLSQFKSITNSEFMKGNTGLLKSIGDLLKQTVQALPGLSLVQFPKTNQCSVCNGTRKAPFTQGSQYAKETRKEKIPDLYKEYAGEIAKAEEQLGDGGNHVIEVTKNMVISVGTVTNDFDSVRIDKKGKGSVAGLKVADEGVYAVEESSPVVEKVHVDNLAGGTLTILGNNKINFVAGAGGVKFRSLGGVDFGGTISNFTGEQVNIASENEVNINGGQRLSLEAKILSLKAGGGSGQLVFDSNVGFNGNALVKGGMSVEGELFVNHITGQMELVPTEDSSPSFGGSVNTDSKTIGFLPSGTTIIIEQNGVSGLFYKDSSGNDQPIFTKGTTPSIKIGTDYAVKTIGTTGKPDENAFSMNPHNHLIRMIPMTLVGSSTNLRKAAKGVAEPGLVKASPLDFSKKGPASSRDKNYVDSGKANNNASNADKSQDSTMVVIGKG